MWKTMSDVIDTITAVDPIDADEDFAEATRHPHSCRCNSCLRWWSLVGPEQLDDEEPYYGPFTFEEIYGANYGKPITIDGDIEIPF